METLVLRSHLQTTNIYVQRQIIRDNIAQLRNLMYKEDFKSLHYLKRKELNQTLEALCTLKIRLDLKINDIEQTSFQFGAPIPKKP
jgi:hypothetical protein